MAGRRADSTMLGRDALKNEISSMRARRAVAGFRDRLALLCIWRGRYAEAMTTQYKKVNCTLAISMSLLPRVSPLIEWICRDVGRRRNINR